jgi:hypothetical protein
MAKVGSAPKLEFRVAGFSPNGHAYENLAAVIHEALGRMDLTTGDLRNLIVTDDDEYGPAIKQFAPAEGYTNDNIYRGVGKILPHFENGHYVCCDLVMHYCVVASFARPKNSLPDGEVDAMRYCLYHELGHCIDYRRRLAHRHVKPPFESNSVILRCANANAETALSEYSACAFSAQFVTPEAFRYMVQQTSDTLKKYLDALANKRQLYLIRRMDLTILRDEVLTAFWRGLIEVTKLHAYRNGNAALHGRLSSPGPEDFTLRRPF